jgi:hypothetical protein
MMTNDLRFRGALFLVAAFALIWPAIYNGQPFYFSDTSAYVRGADAGFMRLTGISSEWSQPARLAEQSPKVTSSTKVWNPYESLSDVEGGGVLAGRSIYYGSFLYFGRLGGEFWLAIFIQAILLVSALTLVLRSCSVNRWPCFAWLIALTCITSAPFFVSFLMPDLLASLTVLACATLIAANGGSCKLERLFWFTLLTFSLLAHSAHILLGVSMLMIGVGAYFIGRRSSMKGGLTIIALSLLVALAGEAAFKYGVTRILGAPPIRPPFLMARTIADGPGYSYLRATCPGNGFIVCRFLDRLPLSADQFLWLHDPSRGVFAASDPKIRRALAQEQLRFFVSVLSYDFSGQISASIRNSLKQASLVGLDEFMYPEARRQEFSAKLPSGIFSRMRQTAAYRGTIPLSWLSPLGGGLAMIGFAYIASVVIRGRFYAASHPLTSIRIAQFVLIGVILNAVICGALSTPHHRYQARVIWLVPIVALIVHFETRRRWCDPATARGYWLFAARQESQP